jgi:hypothetical protein
MPPQLEQLARRDLDRRVAGLQMVQRPDGCMRSTPTFSSSLVITLILDAQHRLWDDRFLGVS